MLALHGMNGIEGVAILYAVIMAFLLSGPLIVGPLAVIFGLLGGKVKRAAHVLGISACVLGGVGLLVGACAAAFLSLGGLTPTDYLLLIGSPLASILLGVIALRLNGRAKRLYP